MIDGAIVGLLLFVFLRLDFAFLIGLMVGILCLIPYLGMALCLIPAMLIALAQYGDLMHPFWVLVIFVASNNIDGIFNGQLGLEIQASNVQIYDRDPSLLGASNDAGALLNSLGQLRNSSAEMGTYAVTHLFTGRDLDGDTLGIAYIGNVCNTHYGVGLSEVRDRGAWIDSLVAAHELGHQLGAVHDGTGACGSSPSQGFLMDAYINGNSAFSQCSKDLIKATMQNAACLVPIGDNIAFTSIPAANAVTESKASGGAGGFTTIWLFVLLSGVIYRFHQGIPASHSNCRN